MREQNVVQNDKKERLPLVSFNADILMGEDYLKWRQLVPEVTSIFKRIVREFVRREEDIDTELNRLGFDLAKEDVCLVLLRAEGDQVVGFTYARPAKSRFDRLSLTKRERKKMGLSIEGYGRVHDQTAELGWTAILKDYRGRNGWVTMMDQLEKTLVDQSYQYLVITAREENDFANKVRSHYSERIVYEEYLPDQKYLGNQAYFRVKL